MENKDFAVFILTHGRPDNIKTLAALKKCNYTGPIYFIIDNEDKCSGRYIKNYGAENVIVFDKKAMADKIDEANNFDERNVITHARNAAFEIAENLGIKYFVQLDDDYGSFLYRNEKHGVSIKNIDKIFDLFINFLKETPTTSIAFSQGGDHIGGFTVLKLKRKCMNSFFCSTDKQFQFIGSVNEDVNTYTTLGSRGVLFFTFTGIQLNQEQTQSQKGGVSDMYTQRGTYFKSFQTVMMHPSSVRVSVMNSNSPRIHHIIKWNNTVPLIINEKHKKK
jgi:hypothetical protein